MKMVTCGEYSTQNKYHGGRSKQHKLCRGDIIKLGRYIFEIKEISSQDGFKNGNFIDFSVTFILYLIRILISEQ